MDVRGVGARHDHGRSACEDARRRGLCHGRRISCSPRRSERIGGRQVRESACARGVCERYDAERNRGADGYRCGRRHRNFACAHIGAGRHTDRCRCDRSRSGCDANGWFHVRGSLA